MREEGGQGAVSVLLIIESLGLLHGFFKNHSQKENRPSIVNQQLPQ